MPESLHERKKEGPHGGRLAALALAALGIVYGDIGTSPLYSLQVCFHGEHAFPVTRDNVYGIVSLVFWTLVIVVAVKYHLYVLRADNHGEGGILALVALVRGRLKKPRSRALFVGLGLFGAALLYGDGAITPAISVLSAVEGLSLVTPKASHIVVPLTLVILFGLFLLQRRGTGGIGRIFGPIMLVWFLVVAILGLYGVVHHPAILAALSPLYALRFFAHHGASGLFVLGGVFLVATGGEALYADMGHFGERPIQIDWFSLVGISLVLNYLAQGARILESPAASERPFYSLAPSWALLPLVVLATVATIIASQAIISGAFSLTQQAIQLGYLPRMETLHTSAEEMGQVYLPAVNWALMVVTLGLVIGFGSSDNLAAAYGIAVSLTMLITTLLAAIVARLVWRWPLPAIAVVTLGFLVFDVAFVAANLVKVAAGGWFPLLAGVVVFVLMSSWHLGRKELEGCVHTGPLQGFLDQLGAGKSPQRVEGTAVFLSRHGDRMPPALQLNLEHNHVLHKRVVIVTVSNEDIPVVPPEERAQVEDLGSGFFRVEMHYGFLQQPGCVDLLARTAEHDLHLDLDDTTFFVGREMLIPGDKKNRLRQWRLYVYTLMARLALGPTGFLLIPYSRVVELWSQVEIC